MKAQRILLLSLAVFLTACASTGKNPADPYEEYNRSVWEFNKGLDKAILKPVAKGYRSLPAPIKKGTSNVLNNLSTLITIPNNVLQGDFKLAGINTGRLVVNTTLGILGIFDPASEMGFPKYVKEDYGQTFGVWGAGPGCCWTQSQTPCRLPGSGCCPPGSTPGHRCPPGKTGRWSRRSRSRSRWSGPCH